MRTATLMTATLRTAILKAATLKTVALGVGVLAIAAHPLTAQTRPYAPEEQRWLDAGWGEDVVFAASNALLSGLVTGLFREISGDGSFGEGFRGGAAGGLITYAGKRVAVEDFDASGLLGRQLASLGGSVASNAREGRGPLDRLTFPLGLGRLTWDRTASSVSFRPDVVTLYYTAVGVASSRVELDWSHSLSSGAPVFLTLDGRTTLDENAAGRAAGGVIVADRNARIPLAEIIAHERVHVLQFDQNLALWSAPAERSLLAVIGGRTADLLGRADIGVIFLPFPPLLGLFSRGDNPFEIEADYLTVR